MGFMKQYGKGAKSSKIWVPCKQGFLRVQYAGNGKLARVGWARTKGGKPEGAELFLEWTNETFVFKTERGLGGASWGPSGVSYGTVFDDAPAGDNPRKIAFEDWIDECVAKMQPG